MHKLEEKTRREENPEAVEYKLKSGGGGNSEGPEGNPEGEEQNLEKVGEKSVSGEDNLEADEIAENLDRDESIMSIFFLSTSSLNVERNNTPTKAD